MHKPSRRAAGCGMLACQRTDARATPTDMSVKRCAAARKREWLSAARKLRSSEGRAWAYAHGISPVAVQLAAACLHASGQMHERRQKNSCPHCRQLFSRKALCYISESAVSSAFTMLFTAVRSALTEARMISTSTPAPQYSTPLFLLLTPT